MPSFAPQNILCPLDLTPASEGILRWAGLLAEAFGSHIEIIHADWSEAPYYFTEGQIGELVAEAAHRRKTLSRQLHHLAEKVLDSRVPFKTSLLDGAPVDTILAHIRTTPPDLIVIGSHGRSGLDRLLLGSVAENIARHADCPTLIVKDPALSAISVDQLQPHLQPQVHNILCPVSLTDTAQHSISIASDVAAALAAALSLLHIVEHNALPPEDARQQLCQRLPDDVRTRCHATEIVRTGDPAEQIILHARAEHPDLIVLGAAHRSFLEFRTLGRTTERVLRHGPSPVLLVPYRTSGH
jgi:nucleotide-binding universal stress UspA family protein